MHVRSGNVNCAIGIEEGDELVAARITDGNQIVFLASHEGAGPSLRREPCHAPWDRALSSGDRPGRKITSST